MKTSSMSTIAVAGGLLAAVAATSPAWAVAKGTPYLTGATLPAGGLWLKHGAGGDLWVSDHTNGFCRLQANPGGLTAVFTTTCFATLPAVAQPAYDPVNKLVYVPDQSSKALGVQQIAFNETTGTLNTRLRSTNIPAPKDASGKGLRIVAVAVDSKGQAYIANGRNGDIHRVTGPNGAALAAPELVGSTSDGGGALSLAFVKNTATAPASDDLYIAEGAVVSVITDVNGVTPGLPACTQANQCTAADAGFADIIAPLSLAYDGKYLYAGDSATLFRINPVTSVVTTYATGFRNPSAVAISSLPVSVTSTTGVTTSKRRVYVGDDATAGAVAGKGNWYQMVRQP